MNFFSSRTTTINSETMEETPFDDLRSSGYRADEFDLGSFPASTCPWHWHNELEFFFIKKGTLEYHTPNEVCRFSDGDAGFVNANILHKTSVPEHSNSIQQYHIFPLEMISIPNNSFVEHEYLEPFNNNCSANVIRFPTDSSQAKIMREKMELAYEIFINKPYGYEIRLRNIASELCLIVLENIPPEFTAHSSKDLSRVKAMVKYMQANFSEHISMDDIANSAHIGTGEGARCFKRTLHMTPFSFLIGYRIDRAKEMLSGSSKPVTEISLDCGFPSTNYFGKTFREKTGMTPSEYRLKYSIR